MKYHIITYGCQMNKSDSERIATKLENQNHQQVPSIEQANLVVINVCSVRQSAIDRVYAKIRSLKKEAKFKIILTGCILNKDRENFKNQANEIWDIAKIDCPPKYQSESQAHIPIMTGCNNFCSYCAVPYTRGREQSMSVEEIIREVKSLVKRNYKEITLLGQNVNSYQGKYKSQKLGIINFPKLLKIIDNIPGNFKIKFLTSHPKDMSDELIKTIAHNQKIDREIHLPVQSGDNEILKKMNRGYTAEHYKNLIKKIRREIPDIRISTDAIVGFPGETKKQFQNTAKLFRWAKFNEAFISRYSPRPGAISAKLKDNVSNEEKKRRWRVLVNLLDKK